MKTDLTHYAPDCLGLDEPSSALARRRTRHVLARIDAALSRMEEGRYGLCTHCNAPIQVELLDADPAVARCYACKSDTPAPGEEI